jgi:hypothetical protein
MLAKKLHQLAEKVPEHRNATYYAQGLAAASIAVPVLTRVLPDAASWVAQPINLAAGVGIALVTLGLEGMLFSKIAVKNRWSITKHTKPVRRLEITLGGMTFDEKSLFTNIIAFGAIGSGKTAAVIYPILDAITGIYNNDDPTVPNAKWGGFVLDVKGDFHEAVIYVMKKHGRDTLSDLVVIRPDNDYYVLEFEEVNTKEHFLVSCMGGTTMQECDFVLSKAEGPDSVLGLDASMNKIIKLPNGDIEALSSFVFNDRGTFRRPEIQKLLSQLEFDVRGVAVRWLGWRDDKSGKLVRVTHTLKREIQYAHAADGSLITTNKPARLRYIGVHSINNGLTYNLISKSAASTEAAGRIMAVAEVTGNSFGNDNAYWSNASEKHMAACIELFRQVEGPMGKECSVNEIQKFTTNEPYLSTYVKKLQGVIKGKQELGASDYEILLLRNLEDYFAGEWLKHDPKTKGNIMSCVTNLFGDVTRNEQLIKTFCQPSRFSFDDCLNDGKVYTLVLSAYPNAQMLIGTCMKLDFQQTVLKRTQAAPVNKTRFLLFLADEYQFFITTSGGGGKTGGDDKFLSVSRQSRIFNLIATQAKTSLLAVQKDENKIDAFIQCFGSRIFLQNLDEKTNKLAEQTTGQFWGEKEDHSGADLKLSSAMGDGRSGNVTRRQEKMNKFEASHFTQMAPFEAVLFNKERLPGRKSLKANLRETARFWDKRELAHAANDYYQSYIENRANQLGLAHLFDARNNLQETAPTEMEQRTKGTLRSWRYGLPIGRPAPAVTPALTTTDLASPDILNDGETQTEDPPMESTQEAIARELGGDLPGFDVFKEYNGRQPPLFSDRLSSQNSDPFFDRAATSVTAVLPKPDGNTAEPAPQAQASSFENDLAENLKGVDKDKGEDIAPQTPVNRVMANRVSIPEIQKTDPEGAKEDASA